MRVSRYMTMPLTWWGAPVRGGFGETSFDSPVVIMGRWSDRQELFLDPQGRELRSRAVAWTDQDLEPGGYLCRGESTETDPRAVEGAAEVRAVSKVWGVKGREAVVKAWL